MTSSIASDFTNQVIKVEKMRGRSKSPSDVNNSYSNPESVHASMSYSNCALLRHTGEKVTKREKQLIGMRKNKKNAFCLITGLKRL
eukprot:CAMPEP_0168339900 /NCGR_PEP_ID=MMETSP0213-20121227/13741_1 /TAXON_ID=151035 /ORGANISM="Euplotes harpa, Strain FSP1.4" /LENGTH=85 /DNA_ID=CAMNT_0008346029 /DNA_START=1474 /DNA_END=1727 /DNA_ORIENTATION=-